MSNPTRDQQANLLERPGRFADLPEIIFVVILITVDDPIRKQNELGTVIQGAVTQPGGIDGRAQVLHWTRTGPVKNWPTVACR